MLLVFKIFPLPLPLVHSTLEAHRLFQQPSVTWKNSVRQTKKTWGCSQLLLSTIHTLPDAQLSGTVFGALFFPLYYKALWYPKLSLPYARKITRLYESARGGLFLTINGSDSRQQSVPRSCNLPPTSTKLNSLSPETT